MTYPILVIRSPEEAVDPLYPQPGSQPNTVVMSAEDGDVTHFRCTGLRTSKRAGGKDVTMGKIDEVKASVFVTQRRVVVACSKFEKATIWGGSGPAGVLVAGLATAASMASAAHRQRGQMLVGQVLYEWLGGALARDRKGFGSVNQVCLMMHDPSEARVLSLYLQLENREAATPHVVDIVARAARYQADATESTEVKQKLLEFARSPAGRVNETTGAVGYVLPTP